MVMQWILMNMKELSTVVILNFYLLVILKILSEIIKVINKNSQNFFAEQLLKTIGLEKMGFGSASNGITACKEIFSEIGLNTENIIMVDGSGLSHLNMVTPRQIVDLLKYMYSNKKVYADFYNSLPIAGVDGSLRKKNAKYNCTK